MFSDLVRRRTSMLWQILFLLLGTTWLWAPHLNPIISYRTSLISQYEVSLQPYAWLFRLGDILAGCLLLYAATIFLKVQKKRQVGWLLLVIAIGMTADPILTTTCRTVGQSCQEYMSFNFGLHALETVVTAAAFVVIALYDSWIRKSLVSIIFVALQVLYGVMFLTQLADKGQFNTASQFAYQTILIVWLAWFCRDYWQGAGYPIGTREAKAVKTIAAAWAFMNGVVAILVSLAHINLFGRIHGLYFAGDSAWLAQHGVIIGVVMLYLSRHLARGELRARQIFLVISGVETLKYSVIAPNPGLMLFYAVTFVMLFVLRDDFDRGVIPLTWQIRLKDLYYMIWALVVTAFIAFLLLDRDNRVSIITGRAINHFFDYIARSNFIAHSSLRSSLLAHTISAFLAASVIAVLWILFRPYRQQTSEAQDYKRVEQSLRLYAHSSEDFFKRWPADKMYYWHADGDGFVAYKPVGPIAFTLADPISQNQPKLLREFKAWCKAHRLRPCFLPVYPVSLAMYEKAGLEILQIGSSALIDIKHFLAETAHDKWWRWQKNRAHKNGYVYDISHPPHAPDLLQQLQAVSDAWLQAGGHQERGFALGYFDKTYLQTCTLHYVKDAGGNIVAFTNELPLLDSTRTVTVDLLRYLPEANNTMPYLLHKTIENVARGNPTVTQFDLGFVPFAKAKGPLLSIAKTLSSNRFSSKGLEQFKNKFDPEWQPNFMAYDGDLVDLALIALNLEKAMQETDPA